MFEWYISLVGLVNTKLNIVSGAVSTCFLFQLKWHDSYDGHGEHYFDYNHGGGYKEPHHEPAYAPPAPAYSAGSEPEGTYVAAPGDARNKRSLPYPEVYYYLA